jgi:hypothetical protein
MRQKRLHLFLENYTLRVFGFRGGLENMPSVVGTREVDMERGAQQTRPPVDVQVVLGDLEAGTLTPDDVDSNIILPPIKNYFLALIRPGPSAIISDSQYREIYSWTCKYQWSLRVCARATIVAINQSEVACQWIAQKYEGCTIVHGIKANLLNFEPWSE